MDQVFEREVLGCQSSGHLLNFRILTREDLSQLVEIAQESFEVVWKEKEFLYFVDNKDGKTLGLFLNGKLLCYCLALDLQGDLDIVSIATRKEFRRQGLAAQVLTELLSKHKGQVFLEVDVRNTPARTFYKKMGFTEGRIRKAYYQGKYDAICMSKA